MNRQLFESQAAGPPPCSKMLRPPNEVLNSLIPKHNHDPKCYAAPFFFFPNFLNFQDVHNIGDHKSFA